MRRPRVLLPFDNSRDHRSILDMNRSKSRGLLGRANRALPGGVNSPVRAFAAVGGSPPFIAEGYGSRIRDEDGNEYLDFVGSWGPLILGHAHSPVVEAIKIAAARGTSFGAPTSLEVELAERVIAAIPSLEMVRFVNSGTEAAMSALRLARAATGRDLIVKFDGCYHGHADGLLVKAGSGAATLGIPDSAGVPEGIASLTISIPYNDLDEIERTFDEFAGRIAAVIVEPVAGNMGVIPPGPGFLEKLRARTSADGAMLIFDEVITGFRVGPHGAQGLYGIRPDITCLGKIVGGGLPVGAYGGSSELMANVAPLGQMYQAGTLSGNPLAMAAGIATLQALEADPPYDALDATSATLGDGFTDALTADGSDVCSNRVGSMLTWFFGPGPVVDYNTAGLSDPDRFARFHRAMFERGVYLPPSRFEAVMVSVAHTQEDIQMAIAAAKDAAESLTG